MASKISVDEVKPGKYYVSKKELFIRAIVDVGEDDNYIYWRDWDFDTGEPLVERLQICSKRAITRWAGREATSQEILRLNHEPLKGEEELLALLELYVNHKIYQSSGGDTSLPIINTGKTYTLFVGVNSYIDSQITDLHVCVNDVTSVSDIFQCKSAEVTLHSDNTSELLPTRNNILASLLKISRLANKDDLVLFYFSGHGIAEGGQSYLLPQDVVLPILKYTALSLREVREVMENSHARAKVIIIDACHSGAIIGKSVNAMTPEFQKHVFEDAEGFVILASCKQGEKSWEWPQESKSVFTYYLLEALSGKADVHQKGFITTLDASYYVLDQVKKWSIEHGTLQTPTLQAEMVGDIVLIKTVPN